MNGMKESPGWVKLEVSLLEIPEVNCSPQKFHQLYSGLYSFPINSHFYLNSLNWIPRSYS